MKNIGFSPSILTLVTVSLLIGFLGGVVFTVYKSPSITSQLTGRGEQASNQIDWAEHISHLKKRCPFGKHAYLASVRLC